MEDKPDLSQWSLKYKAFGRDIEYSWLARNMQVKIVKYGIYLFYIFLFLFKQKKKERNHFNQLIWVFIFLLLLAAYPQSENPLEIS